MKERRMLPCITAVLAVLTVAVGCAGTDENGRRAQEARQGSDVAKAEVTEDRSVTWRGMNMPVPECFVAEPQEFELHLQSTGWCGTVPLERRTTWLTVVHSPDAGVQPFDAWNPCAEFDQCEKNRERIGNVDLECYSAIMRMEHGNLRRTGCRSVERRLAIRYFCLDFFCDRLKDASQRAWASLSGVEPGEEIEPLEKPNGR